MYVFSTQLLRTQLLFEGTTHLKLFLGTSFFIGFDEGEALSVEVENQEVDQRDEVISAATFDGVEHILARED